MSLVRIRVPLVRPLVRCTFKRVLRVLPSVLLLLFVFSLIFVTLMQIAVIHSRRPPAPRPSAPSAAQAPFLLRVNATRPAPAPRRPDTLRVEAFLDRAAPSLDGSAALARAACAASRVRRLIDALGARGATRVTVVPSSEHLFKRERRKAVSCPPVPPDLVGRLRVNVSFPWSRSSVEAALQRSPYLKTSAGWSSPRCSPRHRVALVIPYRDRLEHLSTLLHTLHPLLQRQMLHYSVYVVEQFGNDTFNKGVLMNAGVREALKDLDFHCFVFHDVDMIPEDDRNLYSCPQHPRHLSVAVDKFNYTLPYSMLVGGVFAIRVEHFLAVNGYSNLYWGWGGEDDDMAYRIKYRKLEIIRPPETLARYSMIKHEHRPESPNAIRSALLRMAKKRSSRDGLNTVKYRVLWRHEHPSYTHLMVDIGRHHRWQFLNGQRLVINF